MTQTFKIGTRNSVLAMWQTEKIQAVLTGLGIKSEIKQIETLGEKYSTSPFEDIAKASNEVGLFTGTIERELVEGKIDLAVHSYKDLPTNFSKETVIAYVSKREDPSEILIISRDAFNPNARYLLNENITIGTSSARRESLIRHHFSENIKVTELRGNIPARFEKVGNNQYDAIMIAYAAVKRLNLAHYNQLTECIWNPLKPNKFPPAPAQGAIAVQVRKSDDFLISKLSPLTDVEADDCISIERGILHEVGGGCQTPLGAYCKRIQGDIFQVWCSIAQVRYQPAFVFSHIGTKSELITSVSAQMKLVSKLSVRRT